MLRLVSMRAFGLRKEFEGAKPGDLPIEEPTKFNLSVNLKTAKALGLVVQETLYAPIRSLIESRVRFWLVQMPRRPRQRVRTSAAVQPREHVGKDIGLRLARRQNAISSERFASQSARISSV